MEIDSQALTTCDVSQDGGAISLSFADTIGNPATNLSCCRFDGRLVKLIAPFVRTQQG